MGFVAFQVFVPLPVGGAAADPGGDEEIPSRPGRHDHRDAARQGGPEVVRQREAVLLPAAVHLPLRRRVAAKAGRDAESRRVGAVVTTLRLHRDRKLGPPRHAAARPQRKGTSTIFV